jgi:hypothetical protein
MHLQDLTLCQAKVEEFQISETKYESVFDESITKIKKKRANNDRFCQEIFHKIAKTNSNKFGISLTVSFPGIKYLISEGI